MPLLYLIAFINGISMFSLGIFLSNRTYIQSIINTLAAVLNLLLNLWLVPIYGILGAAISTLIAISFNVILLSFFSTRFYKFIAFSTVAFYLLAITTIIGFVSMIAYLKVDFHMLLVFKILISLALIFFLWKHFQKNIRHGISK
jgi:O-antigen/teichoic acid export membrane protein